MAQPTHVRRQHLCGYHPWHFWEPIMRALKSSTLLFLWHFHQTCRVGLFIWIVKFSLIKKLESGLIVARSCSWSIKKHLCLEIIREPLWTCFMVLRRLYGSRRQIIVSVGLSGPDKDIVPDLKLPRGDKSLVCLSNNWSWESISKSRFHFVIGSHFSIWMLQTSFRIDKVDMTSKRNFMR